MKLQVITMAALLSVSGVAASAQQLDLSLSSSTVLLTYATPISYSAGGHTDADFGLHYTQTKDMLMRAGILMIGEAGSQVPGLDGGVGIRAYGVSLDGANVGAVTLGGLLKYVPPMLNRVGLVAAINYAPDVTSFGDATRFWDFNVRVEYAVLPTASVYVGYRDVGTHVDHNNINNDVELDQRGHIGLRMSF